MTFNQTFYLFLWITHFKRGWWEVLVNNVNTCYLNQLEKLVLSKSDLQRIWIFAPKAHLMLISRKIVSGIFFVQNDGFFWKVKYKILLVNRYHFFNLGSNPLNPSWNLGVYLKEVIFTGSNFGEFREFLAILCEN